MFSLKTNRSRSAGSVVLGRATRGIMSPLKDVLYRSCSLFSPTRSWFRCWIGACSATQSSHPSRTCSDSKSNCCWHRYKSAPKRCISISSTPIPSGWCACVLGAAVALSSSARSPSSATTISNCSMLPRSCPHLLASFICCCTHLW